MSCLAENPFLRKTSRRARFFREFHQTMDMQLPQGDGIAGQQELALINGSDDKEHNGKRHQHHTENQPQDTE